MQDEDELDQIQEETTKQLEIQELEQVQDKTPNKWEIQNKTINK